jgi:hypothetical protein
MTTDQRKRAAQSPASPTESEPLQRLLHLVASEVIRRLRAQQTQPNGPATDGRHR